MILKHLKHLFLTIEASAGGVVECRYTEEVRVTLGHAVSKGISRTGLNPVCVKMNQKNIVLCCRPYLTDVKQSSAKLTHLSFPCLTAAEGWKAWTSLEAILCTKRKKAET